MSLLVTINERLPGVPLTAETTPSAPSLTPVAGQNRMQVVYSQASGGTAQEFVELRVAADGSGKQFQALTVDWGDGSDDTVIAPLGRTLTKFPTHSYTGAGPFTITVTVSFRDTNLADLTTNFNFTPNLSGDWAFDQVQIEKLQEEVIRYAPDWRAVAEVPLDFIDARVVRGFPYKYRVRFRTTDPSGAANVISQFSAQTHQAPWS